MDTGHWNQPLSPQEYAARFDAAKAEALVLRAEAIDALWARLAAGFRDTWHALRRSVIVRAVPAIDRSFGGSTQQGRRMLRQTNAP